MYSSAMSSQHSSDKGAAAVVSPPAAAGPQPGQQWDARLWGALVVLCGVLFLDGLDVSMVGVALPSIGADLDLSTSSLQWVVSGYVLGYGGLLLLGGRFADLLGRRRVLLAALAVFTAASIVGGLVNDGTLLVITRFLKGAAAAFTAPASLSIITTTFAEGPARNRALAIYTACGASGFSLGLVFGGLLTELGWRWTFLLPVPIAIALLIAAPRVLAKDEPAEGPRRGFDFAGAATITAAMLLLVRTVVEAPEAGWSSPETLGGLVLAALLLAAFVAIEQRSAHPLVRLGILRSGTLVRANLGMAAVFGAYVAFQFVGTLYLQQMLGWSPVETALAFLPGGLLVAFGAPRIGPLVDRYGTARIILVGAISFVDRLRAVPANRRDADLRRGVPAEHDPRGCRFRAVLPDAQHPGHRRGCEPRAGPGLGARQHVVPGGRRDRTGDRHGGRELQHERHRRRLDARRVPAGDRGGHRDRGPRSGGGGRGRPARVA